jgi:Zn2+/Cd2+-exporting ATPase
MTVQAAPSLSAIFSAPRATVLLGVDGMVSPRNEHAIEAALAKLPGVKASASFASRSLHVDFDRNQCAMPEIVRRLDQLGLRLRPGGPSPVKAPSPLSIARRAADFLILYHKLAMAAAGAAFLLIAYLLRVTHGPIQVRYACLALSFVVAGWYTARDTFHVLRHFKFDIDVLMFAAAIGAAVIGHYDEGALLLVLFAFGGAGEELAIDRARSAIEALAKLAPDTASVRDESGRERLVRVEDLKIGEHVVIRPFDRVPADAKVAEGASAVDESPITGESIPVEKNAGSRVYAGTINGEGLLIASVTKLAGESTLAKVVNMVREAQTTKSPTQVFTDRVERWYVPCVLIATAALIFLPPFFGKLWSASFYRAMAFLTAASPCALAIGTPAAVLCGIARAARIGVLVKGGVHLENLGRVKIIAFDKTGTLTRGKPQVTQIVCLDSLAENDLLARAAAVERVATHPLALAIVSEANSRGCEKFEATEAQQVPGHGVRARVYDCNVAVGRLEMMPRHSPSPGTPGEGGGEGSIPIARTLHFQENPHPNPLPEYRERGQSALDEALRAIADGQSIVCVAIDDKPVGVIALADQPRLTARDAIARLKRMGIRKTIMLTGDKKSVADAVGNEVGIDEVRAELLPEEKLALVRELQKQYGPLAMVGDGVNDAPALASATVGIAMGGAGTDVAIETADVALMSDDLSRLPDAIGLSRFSRRIISESRDRTGRDRRSGAAGGDGLNLPGRRGDVSRGQHGCRRAEFAAIAGVSSEVIQFFANLFSVPAINL